MPTGQDRISEIAERLATGVNEMLREHGDHVGVDPTWIAGLITEGLAAHRSDCAVHNGPAYPAGPCDCNAPADLAYLLAENARLRAALEEISKFGFRNGHSIMGYIAQNALTAQAEEK